MSSRIRSAAPLAERTIPQLPKPGTRINNIAVIIDQFSYGPKGRKGKEIYNQFFDILMEVGPGVKVRFDQHILTGVQRHQLFKQALKNRAKQFGFDINIGGLRIDQNQYYLEAELLTVK